MIMDDKGDFPYPLDAVKMFVLQVAPVDEHGGHVKAPPSLSLPFYSFRGNFTFFFYMLTQESSFSKHESGSGERGARVT